jgi:hypothetical protein
MPTFVRGEIRSKSYVAPWYSFFDAPGCALSLLGIRAGAGVCGCGHGDNDTSIKLRYEFKVRDHYDFWPNRAEIHAHASSWHTHTDSYYYRNPDFHFDPQW